ncbi:MAG TPA: endonuclease domain-containing protein, partial [Bacteroidales bacterium]
SILYGILYHIEYENRFYTFAFFFFAKVIKNASPKGEGFHPSQNYKLNDYSFRRQRPVGNYIADFICFELRLIIEIDGYSHTLDDVCNKDVVKSNDLKNLGYEVIRFTDAEVLNDISNVIRRLEAYINDFENCPPLPPPTGDSTDKHFKTLIMYNII